MNHQRVVDISSRILNVFPFLYVLVITFLPPAVSGYISGSMAVTGASLILHLVACLILPFYLTFWRNLTSPLRMIYTVILHRFIFHLTALKGLTTSYADISGFKTIDDFYADQKRSIRRRMTGTIPRKLAEADLNVRTMSSNHIGLRNLKINLAQARKYHKTRFAITLQVLSCFVLYGDVIEYRINGKLLAHGIGFKRGGAYTIFQYAAINEASRLGLWFFNVYQHMAHAFELGVPYVNGTIEAHKAEAKANTGMMTTVDEALVFQLYGGRYFNLPKSYYS